MIKRQLIAIGVAVLLPLTGVVAVAAAAATFAAVSAGIRHTLPHVRSVSADRRETR